MVINSLDKIDEWGKRKKEVFLKNKKLIAKLKNFNNKRVKELTEGLHNQVFNQIDCLDCANCCKSIPPIVNETDAKRISKYLRLKVTDFKEQYIRVDEDMDMVINKSPCPFLETDNKCLIYEYRPKACREYPHTKDYEFAKNIKLHATNAVYCPAVFHILERIKTKM